MLACHGVPNAKAFVKETIMAGSFFPRLSLVLAAAASHIAAFGGAIAMAAERLQGFLWSTLAFVVRTIAYPRFEFAGGAGEGFGGFLDRHYQRPPDSMLRHEAGMKRMAADRHV